MYAPCGRTQTAYDYICMAFQFDLHVFMASGTALFVLLKNCPVPPCGPGRIIFETNGAHACIVCISRLSECSY